MNSLNGATFLTSDLRIGRFSHQEQQRLKSIVGACAVESTKERIMKPFEYFQMDKHNDSRGIKGLEPMCADLDEIKFNVEPILPELHYTKYFVERLIGDSICVQTERLWKD